MRGGWRWPLPQSPVLLLLALAGARGEQPTQVLKLDGACSFLNYLNGLLFARQGTTASGAPYYKSAGDAKYYIYYDPNCAGGVDGSPRWIIDNDAPSLTASEDLDGDGNCNFQGLVNSGDSTHPPTKATWRLDCDNGNDGWQEQEITLTDVTFVDYPTTTMTTTTPMPETTTTTTEVPRMLRLEGACEFLSFLNSATFLLQGTTAVGAPFWKTMDLHEYYIYFDPDCHGSGMNGAPRWIIDNDAPHTQRFSDLDEDNDCVYQAHTDSSDKARPPSSGTWSMLCDPGAFRDRQISFFEVTTTTTTTTTTSSTSSTTITVTTVTGTSTSTYTSTTKTTTFTTLTTTTKTTTFTTTTETSTTTATTVTSSSTATLTTTETTLTTGTTSTSTKTEADEAEVHGKCVDFVCPVGWSPRSNSSSILCAAAVCDGVDNMTCCEAPTTTQAAEPTTGVPATTLAVATTNGTMEATTQGVTTTADHHPVVTTTTHPPSGGHHHDAHLGALLLHGVCDFQKNLNGLVFMKHQTSANGSPIYKADGTDVYIYWDEHCDGMETTPPRWIIDADEPDKDKLTDKDGDKGCHYRAKTLNGDSSGPPLNATWDVYCTGGFTEVRLSLDEAFAVVHNGTCEAAGKVTITDVHACGLAANYLNFTSQMIDPTSMEDTEGQPGCFFDHGSSQLQLVSHSEGGHSSDHSSGHSTHSEDSSSHSGDAGGHAATTTHAPNSGDHGHDSHSHEGSHRRLSTSHNREALCAGGDMAVAHSPPGEGSISGASATACGGAAVAAGLLGLVLTWGM